MKADGGVARFMDEHDMIPPGSKVLCAVSGGADSVCLLHMLSQREDVALHAAHFNHQLRGEEADRDEQFVRNICAQWAIPLTVGRGDVRAFSEREGLSLEEGGRILRYAFLKGAAQTEGCDLIATAHNADDNAETVLLNLIRGSGLKGLGGIPPVQGSIVRPLLSTTRADIEAYLDTYHLPHVEDSTNTDERYTRNKVRCQLMPLLKELNPRAVPHINQLAAVCSVADRGLEAEAQRLTGHISPQNGRVVLSAADYLQAPAETRPRILFHLLDKLGVGRKDFGAKHLAAIDRMLRFTPPGRESRLDLPHSVTARSGQGQLILEIRPPKRPKIQLTTGRPVSWGDYTLTLLDHPSGEGLLLCQDLSHVPDRPTPDRGPVTAAPCPPGARLTLPESNGPRTVKRLCLDRGVPLSERDGLPAVYVGRRLAAVWRLGVDIAFSPAPNRNFHQFVQIKYTEKDEET